MTRLLSGILFLILSCVLCLQYAYTADTRFDQNVQLNKGLTLRGIGTQSAPSMGNYKLYPKPDGRLYLLNSDSLEAGIARQSELDDVSALIDSLVVNLSSLASSIADVLGLIETHEAVTTNVHGISDTSTLATKTGSETLANKTLTAPVINSPTGLVKGDVGLGNVDNTSDATKNAATATLTNKDIDGGTASNGNRITLPKAAKTTLDGLTRKEGTLVYATDQAKAYIDNGSSLTAVGSGSGGGINYITNPDFETDTSGWGRYEDSTAVPTVNVSGGSYVSISRTPSSPLRGTASGLISRSATEDALGSGVYINFTIDSADQARVLSGSFDYEISSGTYNTGDMTVYVIDVTNSTVIQPVGYQIAKLGSGVKGTHRFTFQTASNSTSYRLKLHNTSGASASYAIKIDNVSVGPQASVTAAPVTDYTAYTPTLTNGGTVSTNTAFWRRVGSDIEIHGRLVFTGTGTAALFSIQLPSGMTIDSTKMPASLWAVAGNYEAQRSGTIDNGAVETNSTLTNAVVLVPNGTGGAYFGNFTTSGSDIKYKFKVPISGWSSGVTMGGADDARSTTFKAFKSTSQSIPNSADTAIAGYDTGGNNFDTHGMFNPTTGKYTIATPGQHVVLAALDFSSNSTGYRYGGIWRRNSAGTIVETQYGLPMNALSVDSTRVLVFAIMNCNAGDTVEQFGYQNSGGALNVRALAGSTSLQVMKVGGSSSIAAAESVNASYTTAAGQSIPNAASTAVVFGTRDFDSHNAMNSSTGVYTAQVAGKYQISGQIFWNNLTSGSIAALEVYRTIFGGAGTAYTVDVKPPGTGVQTQVSGTLILHLNVGDSVALRAYQSTGSAKSLVADGTYNRFSIAKVGN